MGVVCVLLLDRSIHFTLCALFSHSKHWMCVCIGTRMEPRIDSGMNIEWALFIVGYNRHRWANLLILFSPCKPTPNPAYLDRLKKLLNQKRLTPECQQIRYRTDLRFKQFPLCCTHNIHYCMCIYECKRKGIESFDSFLVLDHCSVRWQSYFSFSLPPSLSLSLCLSFAHYELGVQMAGEQRERL